MSDPKPDKPKYRTCPTCKGKGDIPPLKAKDNPWSRSLCPKCKGEGQLETT